MWPNQKLRLARLENFRFAPGTSGVSLGESVSTMLSLVDLRVDNLVSYLQNSISVGSPMLIDHIGSFSVGAVTFNSPIVVDSINCTSSMFCPANPVYTYFNNPFSSPKVYQSQSLNQCSIPIPIRFSLYVTIISSDIILSSPVMGTSNYTYHDFLKFDRGIDVTFVFYSDHCIMNVIFYYPRSSLFEVSVLTLC